MTDTSKAVDKGGKKGGGRRQPFVWLVIGVIAIAAFVGVGASWLTQQGKQNVPPAAGEQSEAQKAQTLALDGDSAKAHEALEAALKNPQLKDDEKYGLIFQQGITFENEQKFDEAIAKYKEAEAIQANQTVAEALARTAEAKGDKTLALEYYKKALERVPVNHPNAEGNKEFFNYKIKELGGGQ